MMRTVSLTYCVCCILLVSASAIRRNEHDKRTVEKELSDIDHESEGNHNMDYDHEAFLGKEEAQEFDQLSPDESKKRLAKIADKIDADNDGFVSEPELIKWIKYIQKSYVTEDAKNQWTYYQKADSESLSWQEYANNTYGAQALDADDDGEFNFKNMKTRDRRRWKEADSDKDDLLTFEEFVDFLHPEDAEHMRDIVITETMEDIDKNHDGVIDEKEYIGDMWHHGSEEEEPDWVKTEREHFSKWRDLNKDGTMDREEVRHWIMPDDYDHAQAETRHLIYEADKNKDGKLSEEEILEKYDLFVGSQATDFGEALDRSHDEF